LFDVQKVKNYSRFRFGWIFPPDDVFFGFYLARRVAALDPIAALRFE
jgi:hypothetical protein